MRKLLTLVLLLVLLPSQVSASLVLLFNQNVTPPVISLLGPHSGLFLVGSTLTVTWNTDDWGADTVTIEVSYDGGSSWNTVITGTANDGTYDWTVPLPADFNGKIRVKGVANSGVTDQSTGLVKLVGAYRK